MRRKLNATYFEQVLPSLEADEEEVWFTHPFENVKCNQLGVLDFDEEEYIMVDLVHKSCYIRKRNALGKFVISIGTKSNVVWECYHQTKSTSRILHANHNENDYTFDNLHSTADETQYERVSRNKSKREWERLSAERLLEKEAVMAAKGLSKETYRALMTIPKWLSDAADSLV
jgi:hypothetical protein